MGSIANSITSIYRGMSSWITRGNNLLLNLLTSYTNKFDTDKLSQTEPNKSGNHQSSHYTSKSYDWRGRHSPTFLCLYTTYVERATILYRISDVSVFQYHYLACKTVNLTNKTVLKQVTHVTLAQSSSAICICQDDDDWSKRE